MELYGPNQGSEGPEPIRPAEWHDTGLEESMWRLGLGTATATTGAGREVYPERPGLSDCVYYMRTGFCGYGSRCRYNHPRDRTSAASATRLTGGYPEHPGEPVCQGEMECSYYLKTGQCKFGMTCKFHHPQPAGASLQAAAPPFYQMVQSPSFPFPQQVAGASASYRVARPPMLPGSYVPRAYGPMILSPGVVPVSGWTSYSGHASPGPPPGGQTAGGAGASYGVTQLSSSAPALAGPYPEPHFSAVLPSGSKEEKFPQRPGQPDCKYYLKTGDCKFGSSCRYNHPIERGASTSTYVLSPLGLPLRPGTQTCTFYMQHGCCKFGPTCMFDHPMGAINFSPSASSLTEMPPVAPYLSGPSFSALPTTTAPPSEQEPEYGLVPTREPNSSRTPSTSSVSIASTFSQTPPVSL
ncbi:Zinc finger CCCH domain-containing protein [Drosera capensis]